MEIDLTKYSKSQRYYLMTQIIIPRPIAWVLTENEGNSYNLAPFSFFNGISSEPPLVIISIGHKIKAPSPMKDTATNILRSKAFVIHIPSFNHQDQVEASSTELDYGSSELDLIDHPLAEFEGAPLPRLKSAKAAMYCTLYDFQEIGRHKQGLVFGEIKAIHIDDDIVETKGDRIDISSVGLDPLCRLGPKQYDQLSKRK